MKHTILLGHDAIGGYAKLDLDVLLKTRLLVQANSGGGKSWLLRRLAEQLYGKIPTIIIDPEGEFATLREKYGYVLVGHGGETPADLRSATMVAHKLLELRASAVCDLYELKPQHRHQWVRVFLDALIDAPKNLWRPTVIIVDEAHQFCPEGKAGESEASSGMVDLATRGRKRGFCAIFATQRLGKLRKDAAAELLNVMIGMTFIDIDRERAAECLGVSREEKHGFNDQVKLLSEGKFYCLGRAICKERTLVKVGGVETTHPEAGGGKFAMTPPPAPEEVRAMMPKLADLPKHAEEKAKTEAELRSEIRSLKAQLRLTPVVEKPVETIKRVEVPVLKDGQLNRLEKMLTQMVDISGRVELSSIGIKQGILAIKQSAPPAVVKTTTPPRLVPTPARISKREETGAGGVSKKLRAGAERMLAALAQWHPNGMQEGQLRSHAGLKKSGTYSAYMTDLRNGGFISQNGNGLICATEEGVAYCGDLPPAPTTTEEVLAIWKPKLRDGARRMLDIIVQAGGEPVPKVDLFEQAGIVKSGTSSAYLTDLKTSRLIVVHRETVQADKETLFL